MLDRQKIVRAKGISHWSRGREHSLFHTTTQIPASERVCASSLSTSTLFCRTFNPQPSTLFFAVNDPTKENSPVIVGLIRPFDCRNDTGKESWTHWGANRWSLRPRDSNARGHFQIQPLPPPLIHKRLPLYLTASLGHT